MRDLRAVDDELDGLSTERQQYRLLHEVCGALEELSELGAAGLFWGERAADGGDDHVRLVRGRVGRLREAARARPKADDRRSSTRSSTRRRTPSSSRETFSRRSGRKSSASWNGASNARSARFPPAQSVMPWTRGGEDDERFRKSLAASLLVSLLLGLLLPLIDLPLPEPWEVIEVPDRLVRLIREERPLPPPPPTQAETRPEKKPKPTEEPRGAGTGPADEAEASHEVEGHPRLPGEVLRARGEQAGCPARGEGAHHELRVRPGARGRHARW